MASNPGSLQHGEESLLIPSTPPKYRNYSTNLTQHSELNNCEANTSTDIPTRSAAPDTASSLPLLQFSLLLLLQLVEPITALVVYPFLPELIRDLGVTEGDETKVGYYVGSLESLFFLTQAFTVLYWSRLSDRIGRKPVILLGLLGACASSYSFGLSRSLSGLLFSRALNGALNGNIGVMRSLLAEITDETNIAMALSWTPLSWSTGVAIAPLIGGSLARPAERWPEYFGRIRLFHEYPYFLPCAVAASFAGVVWFIACCFLKETNAAAESTFWLKYKLGSKGAGPDDKVPHYPMRTFLTSRVLLAASNYAVLSLIEISFRAMYPTFLATPPCFGGPGLEPPTIGLLIMSQGVVNGVVRVMSFQPLLRILGHRRLYMIGIASSGATIALYPIISALIRLSHGEACGTEGSLGLVIWAALILQLLLVIVLNTCFSCIFIYINAAAPSKEALGLTNGFCQMTVSFMRAIGPSLANTLFSVSLELQFEKGHGWIGGSLVYGVLLVVVGLGLGMGSMLPEKPWKQQGMR